LIVVSGVLVLVALVFLIIGLLQNSGLGFIWASIITSVVAGVFLLLGALQRRGAPAPVAEGGATSGEMLDRVTAVSVRPREAAAEEAPAEAPAPTVAVVRGRPRYHVEGCRFLAGRQDVELLPVDEARGEGFTACGVCKPDAALAAAETAPPADAAPIDETATFAPPADETPADEAVADEAPADAAAVEEPAAPARKAAAKKAPARTAAAAGTATKATASTTKATPAKATAGTATKAAARPAGTTAGQVVVIPDRGKFHIETCRFVKDVPGTVNLSKAAAKRQGYTPCGVCKP
jgi:hypothetical protein